MSSTEQVTETTETLPVFDMTILPDAHSEYGVLVRGLCEELFSSQTSVLRSYWTAGQLLHDFAVAQLVDGGKKNTAEMIRQLSGDIHDVSGGQLDYSESTLRKMMQFREAVSAEQLTRLQRLGVPVSKALSMCIHDVTDDQRDTIIAELESGALDSANVPERVKDLCPEDTRKENRGGTGPFNTLSKLEKAVSKAITLVRKDVTEMSSAVLGEGTASDSDRLDYKEYLKKLEGLMGTLDTEWSRITEGYLSDDDV